MSTPPLKILLIIAEHSICQPGLPSPHGEFHEGSFSFDIFHNAKSSLFFLSDSISTLVPETTSSFFLPESFKYFSYLSTSKYTPDSVEYAYPLSIKISMR